MTEERIKEIYEKHLSKKYKPPSDPEERKARDRHIEYLMPAFRTVAAEAREEGRKEGIDELCNSLSNRLRRGPQAGVALIVEDEAEQLKEKGNE